MIHCISFLVVVSDLYQGILQPDTTDQERVWVARVVIDHWYKRTSDWPPKKRFRMLYDAFRMLKEKSIAEEIKKRFQVGLYHGDGDGFLLDLDFFLVVEVGPEITVHGGLGL